MLIGPVWVGGVGFCLCRLLIGGTHTIGVWKSECLAVNADRLDCRELAMGFGTTSSKEAAMEEFANLQVKQVREALSELLLPPEVIDQALQKISEFGGDIDRIATYALTLPFSEPVQVPQVECIEEQLSDDMVSSDEDACVESEEKWMQLPSSVQSTTAQAPKVEQWEDPICKLFHASENGSGSSTAVGESDQGKVTVEAEAGSSSQFPLDRPIKKEMEPAASAAPPAPPASPAPLAAPAAPAAPPSAPLSCAQREAFFLEMGFAYDLVHRAFQHHGAEADNSVLLQFLIDNVENNPGMTQHDEEESEDDAELRARVQHNIAVRSLKALPARRLRVNKGSSSSDSDSDTQVPAVTPCNNWEAEPSNVSEITAHRAAMHVMGFSSAMVERAITELGKAIDHDMLLDYLLFLSSDQQDGVASTSVSPPRKTETDTLKKLTTDFQFPSAAVEKAIARCNVPLYNATQNQIAEVVDFLAAHIEALIEEDAINLPDSDYSDDEESVLDGEGDDLEDEFSYWDGEKGKGSSTRGGKRKPESPLMAKGKMLVQRGRPRGVSNSVKKSPRIGVRKHKGATGFGLPGFPVKNRQLEEHIKGAPFFYFENVATMPRGAWGRIQSFLFDVAPEFVDAMYFSPCRRSRGYIHNLPVEGRRKLIKDPPMTIMDLMPQTKPFWPEWDLRLKLNCINTVRASGFASKKLGIEDGTALEVSPNLTSEEKRAKVAVCCKLNLVWTSPNIATPVEANEIEAMLGYDRDHSRPCFGSGARYKALGNSFSVYTVGYHFSVLKPLYPKGIKVLSLFSGIGGAEVALHKVGVELDVVVSVEIEEEPRRCLQTWWAMTKQTGRLDLTYHDVQSLTRDVLMKLVQKYRGFDFIVGGSPCNNLTGNNRHTRTGLDGEHSTMFFEFQRIVRDVRELTIKLQGGR